MTAFLTTICLVLMGPIAMEAGTANEGDEIELPAADAEQFARWGYVRIIEKPPVEVTSDQVIEGLPKIAAPNPSEEGKSADLLASVETKETAAQKKKREAAEAKAAEELAAQEARELADKLAAETQETPA